MDGLRVPEIISIPKLTCFFFFCKNMLFFGRVLGGIPVCFFCACSAQISSFSPFRLDSASVKKNPLANRMHTGGLGYRSNTGLAPYVFPSCRMHTRTHPQTDVRAQQPCCWALPSPHHGPRGGRHLPHAGDRQRHRLRHGQLDVVLRRLLPAPARHPQRLPVAVLAEPLAVRLRGHAHAPRCPSIPFSFCFPAQEMLYVFGGL